MRRLVIIFLFTAVFLILLTSNSKVHATSWDELDAEEVSDRAEVVVIGTYNFSSKPKQGVYFQGIEFNVKGVYRGEAPKKLIAGIDGFDVGWASEFQQEGGEFLLFLEKSEEDSFLLTVGGPNGMVQILDGQISNQSNKNKMFYEGILKEQSQAPSTDANNAADSSQSLGFVTIFLIILFGGLVIFILRYLLAKKK